MRIALDTNVLLRTMLRDDAERTDAAEALLTCDRPLQRNYRQRHRA